MAEEVHFRLSRALLDRLDAVAVAWGTSRSGAIRRLIEECSADGTVSEPPTLGEMLAVAGERARRGNIAAMNFLVSHQPDEREREFQRLLQRLGAGDG